MRRTLAAFFLSGLLIISTTGCTEGFDSIKSTNDETIDSISQSQGLGHGLTSSNDLTSSIGNMTDTGSENSPNNPEEPSEPDLTTDPAISEKLIYTADVHMETIQFDTILTSIQSILSDTGGFIETSSVTGDTQYNDDGTAYIINRHASYVLRIPADQFQQVLTQINDLGSITYSTQEATNVSSQFTDNEARLEALTTQEESLLNIMAQTTDVDALITLQDSIADVRYEIEYVERTLRDLQSAVSYSTINLKVSETADTIHIVSGNQSFLQRLGAGFQTGWEAVLDFVQNAAVAISTVSPVIIIGAIVLILFLRHRKKHPVRVPKDPDEKEEK